MKEINPGGMVKMVSDRPFTSRGFLLPGLKPLHWNLVECSEVECLKKELSGEERIIYLQLDETISVEKIENNFMIEKKGKNFHREVFCSLRYFYSLF